MPDQLVMEIIWIVFPAFWCVANALAARMSGWHSLAEIYRAADDIEGECFRFASMSSGSGLFRTNYSGCMVFVIGRRGFRLSPFFLFRPFHPPLFIPWSKVISIESVEARFFSASVLTVAGFTKPISIYGRAGDALLREFKKQQ